MDRKCAGARPVINAGYMKAVVKEAPGVGHIALRDWDVPSAGPGEVVIKVHAAGLCGTDIHIFLDEFKSRPPVVLGHEVCGEVVELGDGVDGDILGSRVSTETYFATCRTCRYCRAGQSNLCHNRFSIGSAVDGGFAEFVAVPAGNLHPMPTHISYREGAMTEPLACVVQGVQLCSAPVRAGEVAVIAGPGAIGLLTLQLAKAAGAEVAVLGTEQDARRLAVAEELGADHVVNVSLHDPLPLIEDQTRGYGADVVYECSGAGPAAAQLLQLVRRRGRYVQVGLFGKAHHLGPGPGVLQGASCDGKQCEHPGVLDEGGAPPVQRRRGRQAATHAFFSAC